MGEIVDLAFAYPNCERLATLVRGETGDRRNVPQSEKMENVPPVPSFFSLEAGRVQVEKFSLSHPDLAIGIIPGQRIDLPADAGRGIRLR